MHLREIEIFETDKNKKGDLFGRLIGDFFYALGYDEPRLNIHKSGREIDIQATHRAEKKIVIAECKAHNETIGGSDLNKFAGALQAEKAQLIKSSKFLDHDIIGYFISISGFKETAIEQEQNSNDRMILIDAQKIMKELIAGKIIVSVEQAINNVPKNDSVELINYVDLIASNIGWIWVLYYGNNQTITHFSLIHAEGNPLVQKLAFEIIKIDKKLKKKFDGLTYLMPLEEKDTVISANMAKEKYFRYLENECGEIQFEGLPTDKDAGSVKVKLENIFEPLHLIEVGTTIEIDEENNDLELDNLRESVGEILQKNTRLAILAKPGGGKSTLIKRIAVAYAFPEKQRLVNDNLPNKDFFPIFIRCRELGNKVTSSITDIINDIPNKAEISDSIDGFKICISNALQSGKALLLIDGLDEISIDRDRINFVNQLRKFLSTYPNTSIITTSRKAGFRAVGGILAHYCKQYEVSSLSSTEIRELSKKWHIAILDDSIQTVNESDELVDQILNDSRIVALAENPLLLTTLLFVKRWAGYLPTKRHILYQEMIKLLLVTWNVEGHEQLDIDETEPQLAFVAFWMTQNGQQTLTESELKKCLQDARKEMPDILGYTNISVSDFIKRVESRSSLLIMSGHTQQEDNSLVPIYEFLHLSFQEYLTAKAVVDKSLPQAMHHQNNLEILKPYVLQENWKEVVPLVAVLSKRDNRDLITYLIEESKEALQKKGKEDSFVLGYPATLLGNCIANEIQITPELLDKALEWYAKSNYMMYDKRITELIIYGKFSTAFSDLLNRLFCSDYDDKYFAEIGGLLGEIYLLKNKTLDKSTLLRQIQTTILANEVNTSSLGFLSLMAFVYEYARAEMGDFANSEEYVSIIKNLIDHLSNNIQIDDKHYLFSAVWSLAWIFENEVILEKISLKKEISFKLIDLWLQDSEPNLCRMSAWTLTNTFKANKQLMDYIKKIPSIKQRVQQKYDDNANTYDSLLSVCIGIELKLAWDQETINNVFKTERKYLKTNQLFKTYAKKLHISEQSNS